MYGPVRIPRTLPPRGKLMALVTMLVAPVGVLVTVLRTMPHPPPADRLTLDELQPITPDAAHTEMLAAMVRARIAQSDVTASASPAATAPACTEPSTPYAWD